MSRWLLQSSSGSLSENFPPTEDIEGLDDGNKASNAEDNSDAIGFSESLVSSDI